MKEQKDNMCNINFMCNHGDNDYNRCNYFKSKTSVRRCDYLCDGFVCNSTVAKINKMVLILKDAGFKVVKDD